MNAYYDWQSSQLQSTMGNKNMKYGNGKRANAPDDIFNEQELNLVSKETGSHKRDQLALLN